MRNGAPGAVAAAGPGWCDPVASAAVKFSTAVPGLSRYPPIEPPWSAAMTPDDVQLVARTADDLGFDGLFVPEHLDLPVGLADAMGAHWPHALTAMAFLAGATRRIAVASSVVILPLHHPVALAKAVATLDVLSGGRVILAVGVGHAKEEFDALGVPFAERGRIADEYLEAMGHLWSDEEPVFEGRFVRFEGVRFEPKPRQTPHPPIWIGGNSRAALRRAARFGQGWFPWLVTADQLPALLAELRAEPDFGPPERPFDVVCSVSSPRVRESDHRPLEGDEGRPVPLDSRQAVVDAVAHLDGLGVTWTSVPFPGRRAESLGEHLDQLAWAATEILPLFRDGSPPGEDRDPT